jgi:lipopolysaccharide transport system permease protein
MLTARNVAVIYRQSFLGIGWALIRPVITALIFTIIFGRIAGFESQVQSTRYPLFVLTGLVIWNFFASSLASASESVVAQANVISKTYFPRLILPLSAIGVASVDFLVQLMLLLVFMVLSVSKPTIAILTLPLWFAAAAAVALASGLWLTALNVRFRDVKHAVPFLIQTMLYLTPVIYPASLIPPSWQWISGLNPMFCIVQGFRWSLLGTEAPNLPSLLLSLLITISLLLCGLVFFRRVESTFADIV